MAVTEKQRANLVAPIKKGEVRNPSGKNQHSTPESIRELARRSCPTAIRKLIKLVGSRDDRIALQAAAKVVEIGLGGEGASEAGGKGLVINIMPAPEPAPKVVNHTAANGNHAPERLDAPRVSIAPVGVSA